MSLRLFAEFPLLYQGKPHVQRSLGQRESDPQISQRHPVQLEVGYVVRIIFFATSTHKK